MQPEWHVTFSNATACEHLIVPIAIYISNNALASVNDPEMRHKIHYINQETVEDFL